MTRKRVRPSKEMKRLATRKKKAARLREATKQRSVARLRRQLIVEALRAKTPEELSAYASHPSDKAPIALAQMVLAEKCKKFVRTLSDEQLSELIETKSKHPWPISGLINERRYREGKKHTLLRKQIDQLSLDELQNVVSGNQTTYTNEQVAYAARLLDMVKMLRAMPAKELLGIASGGNNTKWSQTLAGLVATERWVELVLIRHSQHERKNKDKQEPSDSMEDESKRPRWC
jgi:hypothetical protein